VVTDNWSLEIFGYVHVFSFQVAHVLFLWFTMTLRTMSIEAGV